MTQPRPTGSASVYLGLGVAIGMLGALLGAELRERVGAGPAERDLRRIAQVQGLVESSYVHDLEPHSLRDGALEGMLGNLDAYSRFYDRDEAQGLERETAGVFRGIGVSFVPGPERWVVLYALPSSPAERAGLGLGDRFVALEGRPVETWRDEELRARIGDESGAAFELEVADRAGARRTVRLAPEPVLDPSVRHVWMLEPELGLGYVSIASFSKRTAAEFDRAIGDLRERGLSGLVLDLRGNLGGVLDAATHVADRILTEGAIVRSVTRTGETVVRAGAEEAFLAGLPIVVLVDRETASSSEVLAGALQDHRAALVVGERTYGKGTVQTLTRLPDGEGIVKLTTALYKTPSGRQIERSLEGAWHSGLEPDVSLAPDAAEREALRAFLAGYTPPLARQDELFAWETERGAELIRRPPRDAALVTALGLLAGERPPPRPLSERP